MMRLIAIAIVLGGCNPKPSLDDVTKRLRLEYFPADAAKASALANEDDPSKAATVVAMPGTNCTPDLTNCGVLITGEAKDVTAVPMTCVNETTQVTAVGPIVARWRTSLERQGAIESVTLNEVARLPGVIDRVLAATLIAKPAEGQIYGPPTCIGLLLDVNGSVVPVSQDPCASQQQEQLAQAFRIKGYAGVFLHVRTLLPGSNGAFVVYVENGRVTPLTLPVCGGNG